MSSWVLGTAAVAVAVALALFVPYLTDDRALVASTPTPRAVFSVEFVEVKEDERLCVTGVTIPPEAEQVRFQALTYGRPGPPLTVELRALGYVERARVRGGYPDETVQAVAIEPPSSARIGRICMTNDGRAKLGFVATAEARSMSRSVTLVQGDEQDQDVYLAFYERDEASVLDRLGAIVDRMDAFRPGIVGPWLLWPLLVLVALAIPAGVIWAALRGAREPS